MNLSTVNHVCRRLPIAVLNEPRSGNKYTFIYLFIYQRTLHMEYNFISTSMHVAQCTYKCINACSTWSLSASMHSAHGEQVHQGMLHMEYKCIKA